MLDEGWVGADYPEDEESEGDEFEGNRDDDDDDYYGRGEIIFWDSKKFAKQQPGCRVHSYDDKYDDSCMARLFLIRRLRLLSFAERRAFRTNHKRC